MSGTHMVSMHIRRIKCVTFGTEYAEGKWVRFRFSRAEIGDIHPRFRYYNHHLTGLFCFSFGCAIAVPFLSVTLCLDPSTT